jgi:hypothetical protein
MFNSYGTPAHTDTALGWYWVGGGGAWWVITAEGYTSTMHNVVSESTFVAYFYQKTVNVRIYTISALFKLSYLYLQ